MRLQPRPTLAQIPEAIHGALDFAELERLGLAPDSVCDFSVNGNPYGPSPSVQAALAQVPYDRYPDREALALRRVLAAQLAVSMEEILVGNGSSELVWLTALAFVQPGDAVLLLGPTFGEYTRAALLMGAVLHQYTALPETGFQFNTADIPAALARWQPRLVFVCTPNNPTGTLIPPAELTAWAAQCPATLFLVDEAYLTFATAAPSVIPQRPPNMLVLRSMTKAYALAGLRLGYAVGDPDVLTLLRQAQPPWSVNALAQAAGIAALQDTAHLTDCLARIASATTTLRAGLQALGGTPCASSTHFFLLPVDDGAACRQALLRHGLLVRDCASFGLPSYIRLAARRPEDNARLLATLAELRPWSASC